MRHIRILLALSFAIVLLSGTAVAQDYVLNPDHNPPPCWENPDTCVGGGGSNWPSHSTCTNSAGCDVCVWSEELQRDMCGKAYNMSGGCDCGYKWADNSEQTAVACEPKGVCTYSR